MANSNNTIAAAQQLLGNSAFVSVTVVTVDANGRIEAITASNCLCPLAHAAVNDMCALGVAQALAPTSTVALPERQN